MSDTTTLNGVDYAAPIPDAVRRASRRADELARESGSVNVPASDKDGGSGDPATTTVVENGDGSSAQASQAPAPPAQQPQPQQSQPSQGEDWEQKYRSLQGMYNTEVPGLRARIQGLESVLTTIQTPPAPTPQPSHANHANAPQVEIPEQDVTDYGDLIPAARRWARAEIEPELSNMRTQISELRGRTQVTHETTQQLSTASQLDRDPEIGGSWLRTNSDPAFLAWLNVQDPFSGRQRLLMLQEAYNAGDVVRTAAFFKRFYAEHTAGSQPGQPGPTTASAAEGRLSLESLAAPGRANGAPGHGAEPGKRIWTTAEINAFYRDRQRGSHRHREAEMRAVEEDLIAAGREGRIR